MAIYENIKLDKGLYTTNKGFLAELESADPSENYKGTALEGLDAYERQLKRFGIRISGENSDAVEKFFTTSDSATLFPEYVSRAVRVGLQKADILSDIVATKTTINSLDYRVVTSLPAEDEQSMIALAEGTTLPEVQMQLQENLVHLRKHGRMLCASYEAIRSQKLDFFTVMLRQIGVYIALAQTRDAIHVLKAGDGNSNAAPHLHTAAPDILTYDDLVDFWNLFDPYELNRIIAAPGIAAAILKMDEMRDAAAGLSFHANGNVVTPLGAKLLKNGNVDANTLIGLDKNYALEMVQTGDILTEYDKLIDRQLERVSISQIAGFAKIFRDASKALTTAAA